MLACNLFFRKGIIILFLVSLTEEQIPLFAYACNVVKGPIEAFNNKNGKVVNAKDVLPLYELNLKENTYIHVKNEEQKDLLLSLLSLFTIHFLEERKYYDESEFERY